jgi:hypothetical protein
MSTAVENNSLSITASDVSGQKTVRVAGLSRETTIGELAQELVPKMSLPEMDVEGRPLAYHVRLEREGRHLHASEIAGDVLQPGDRIALAPSIMAGGYSD